MNLNLDKLLQDASEIVVEAGKKLMPYFGNIEHQAKTHPHDVVTELDKSTEKEIASRLEKLDPTIGFRGEEFGFSKKADTYWLLDPIDGTMHFVRGMPFCTTMLALIHENRPVLAIINNFVTNELLTAVEGGGTFCNGKRVNVSDRPNGQFILSLETKLKKPANTKLRDELRKRAYLIQVICSGYEFCLVAQGKIEGRVCKDPLGYDYDFAPGCLLVKEAGGVVTNIGSTKYDFSNRDLIAASPKLYKELVETKNALFPVGE
ncbi:inositol monophosphatase family protein [Candidatus Saccharibacteria bacterium]|nr:inositol monophosphatase family protein [Candidatus Saccharibacteria bacterium]